jgi:hypothetical protein
MNFHRKSCASRILRYAPVSGGGAGIMDRYGKSGDDGFIEVPIKYANIYCQDVVRIVVW